MGRPWCAGSNLSTTFLTQPAHHRCYGSKERLAQGGDRWRAQWEALVKSQKHGKPWRPLPSEESGR